MDKPDVTLLDPEFLRGMARVMGDSLKSGKYGRDSWKTFDLDYAKKRMASAMRHLLDMVDGEMNDKESGELNAYHLGCNAMIIAFYYKQLKEESDRVAKNFEAYRKGFLK